METVTTTADETGRRILLDWLAGHVNRDLDVSPQVLWHYTTAAGMVGIVRAQSLWATEVNYLNDASEARHGTDLFLKTLAEHDLTRVSAVTGRFIEGLVDEQKRPIRSFLDERLSIFVTCFCEDGDLLSQWRGYGGVDRAGGYALGFVPPGAAPAWAQSAHGGQRVDLRRVLYDPKEQRAECEAIIGPLVQLLDTDPSDIEVQNSFARNLMDALGEVITWCKHEAFSEEREWRAIYNRHTEDAGLPLAFRTSDGVVVPYVELALLRGVGEYADRLPIEHVNCGPSPEAELKRAGAERFLWESGYGSVDVQASVAPLRV